ncbi:MAG TPA: ATP-binding protein [Candidatus Angelobacter sp.]|jgi:type II secretory pathway predicted ATPase ExeA|nr:ATP-binding protein [Candidatus Angelobacter sp.]
MNKRLLNLYSLKFNPFSSQLPATALWVSPPIQSFCWRIEHQVGEGGFALAVGDPGVGKSAALRILSEHLQGLRDLCVGILTRPQAKTADFYRELGHLFGVSLSPNNRWHSSKSLREKWLAHIEATVYRPVLIIDEAQEMNPLVLAELRMLASADLDSRSILTIILAGDQRLAVRFEEPDLLPIASRIRSRLRLEALPPKQLQECLNHLLKAAGNPKLFSPSLIQTLCEHAAGNLRLLMNLANDLLVAACQQEREIIDEKLYFEVFALDPKPSKKI